MPPAGLNVLYPWKVEKPRKGVSHRLPALMNWAVVVAIILFYRPLFMSESEKSTARFGLPDYVSHNSVTSAIPPGQSVIDNIVSIDNPSYVDVSDVALPVEEPIQNTDDVLISADDIVILDPVQSQVVVELYRLSFYDPMIGRFFPDIALINCAVWDVMTNSCVSSLANGDDFRDWYGRGLACPPGHQLGDVLHVIYPEQLRGDWTCVDRGGGIEGDLLDFLLLYPDDIWTGYNLDNFPWASPVVVEVRK